MARKIGDKLFTEFETRLQNISQAQNCILLADPRGLLIEAARAMIDVVETRGEDNKGPLIDLMHHVGGSSPGEAWCMSFVQSCVAYVERKIAVKSPLHHSAGCMAVWNNTNEEQRAKTYPLGGAIVIWQAMEDLNKGHTGVVIDCDGNSMHTVEGNTALSRHLYNGVVREGDGIHLNPRPWDLYNADQRGLKLKGALKPF